MTAGLNEWRRAICSSDLRPVPRHVALTLSLYVNGSTGTAYPGKSRLVADTGLVKRTVGLALADLEQAGYLVVVRRGSSLAGQKRMATEYLIAIPTGAGDAPVTTGAGDALVHLTTTTGAGDAPQLVKNYSKTGANASADHTPIIAAFDEAWSVYPKRTAAEGRAACLSGSRQGGSRSGRTLPSSPELRAKKAGTEARYCLNGSTFFGPDERWTDYLTERELPEVVYTSPEVPKWD